MNVIYHIELIFSFYAPFCPLNFSLVGRTSLGSLRHGKRNEMICVGLRFAQSDLQFIMTIYQLEMVLHSVRTTQGMPYPFITLLYPKLPFM